MSSDSAHSIVSYTSVSSETRSWSIPTVDPYEEAARQALEQASSPLSPAYVTEPVYLEYLAPSDDDILVEYQPLLADASPTALSPGYVVDSDLEEDLEEDPADYPVNRGDDEDDADNEDEEEAFEEEYDDDEEEEHLALVDSSAVPTVDPVSSAEDTESFETDESAPTPPPPRSRRAGIFVRLLPPMTASMKACIAEYVAAPTLPSPLTPLSSLLLQIPLPPLRVPSPPITSPTYAKAPLGYKVARIRLRVTSPSTHHLSEIASPPLLLPSTSHREDIPKAEVSPQKRLCSTAPTSRFEIGESLAAAAARQPGSFVACRAAAAAVRVVYLRVSYQADVPEIEVLRREWLDYERERGRERERGGESSETRQALARSEAHNRALETRIATMETQLYRLEWQLQDADDLATGAMMHIHVLEARARIDTLEDTSSSA
ncbi:hypothetical protein Tco_0694095 [Tanacetum coccineum]